MGSTKKKFTKPGKSDILNKSNVVDRILPRIGGNEFMAHI